MNREEWLDKFSRNCVSYPINMLPSFPRRNARKIVLGELVMDDNGRALGLVNPTLSDSVEVAIVALYLSDRFRVNGVGARLTATACRWLTMKGWQDVASGKIIPSEDLIALAEEKVRWMEDAGFGAYPHALVPVQARRTQTTRLLKVACTGNTMRAHEEYIVRMSAAQFDRGAPMCGVCGSRMSLV